MSIFAGKDPIWTARRGSVSAGLVGHWDSMAMSAADRMGNILYDISGNNNHGTLTNGARFENRGINFGVSATCSLNSQISLTSDFTFCMFLMFTSYIDTGPNNHQYFFTTPSLSFGYCLMRLDQALYLRTESGFIGFGFPTVNLNEWFYLTIIRSGSSVEYFRNTAKSGSTLTLGGATYINNIDSINSHSNNTCNYQDIRIYNRALSQSEITRIFNATRARFGV